MRTSAKFLLVTSLFTCQMLHAATAYTLELANSSPVKDISLKSATVKIAVYSNGAPQGFQEVLTDQNQSFSLDGKFADPLAVEILSVKNENKQFSCHGVAEPGQTKISLSCEQ